MSILPNDAAALNPEDIISGDNGQRQSLTIRRTMTVVDPRKRRQCVERLCEDQFGNAYLIYSAKLPDGEVWEVADRIKPSVIAGYGGVTDDLFDDFRTKAFLAFNRAEKKLIAHAGAARAMAAHIATGNS